MLIEPDKAQIVVLAIAHSHNFLRKSSSFSAFYVSLTSLNTEINNQLNVGNCHNDDMTSFRSLRNVPRISPTRFKEFRNELADYFMREERVSWQEEYS